MPQENKLTLIDWIDGAGLASIGLYVIFASIFTAAFSKLHVMIPLIKVPIFPGEMVLFFALFLLFLKLEITGVIKWWHWCWFTFGLGILVVAVSAFTSGGGAFVLRQAAMFYYMFFALLGYSFYNPKLLKRPIFYWVIITVAAVIMIFNLSSSYYWFTYFIVAAALLCNLSNRTVTASIIAILFLWYCPRMFIDSRSHLIGLALALLFAAVILVFYFTALKVIARILLIISIILMMMLGIYFSADRNGLKSIVTPWEVVRMYHENKDFIKKHEKTFVPELLPVKLYHHDPWIKAKEERRMAAERKNVEEGKDVVESKVVEESKVVTESKEVEQSKNVPGQKQVNNAPQAQVNFMRHHKPVQITQLQSTKQENAQVTGGGSAVAKQEVDKVVVAPEIRLTAEAQDLETKKDKEFRSLVVAYDNILFRWFIWEDMCKEIIEGRSWLGVGFAKPQRSRSIEILGWGDIEWRQDGWITPHNSFLHLIYRAGLIGFFIIVLMVTAFIYLLKIFLHNRSIKGILLLSVILYWGIMANFLLILELPYFAILFWSFLGITFAYAKQQRI